MAISFSQFIKKLLALDVIFGAKAKKLHGIQDRGNIIDGTITFNSIGNQIIITGVTIDPRNWLTPGKYIRPNLSNFLPPLPPSPQSAGQTPNPTTNDYQLYNVAGVMYAGGVVTITVNPSAIGVNSMVSYGPVLGQIDGRIWAVANDPNIARAGANFDTIYNLNNQASTGLPDGSGVAAPLAEHYHGNLDIVTSNLNSYGHTLVTYDVPTATFIPAGPTVVCDNDGNVIYRT